MQLTTLLSQKKAAILGRWLTMIYESYPPETAIFLRKEKNRFDNPAGYRISEGLEGLYGALLQEMERDQVLTCLDEIIRIRALQNFTPSQALAFIFLLKNVIREELAEEIRKENLAAETPGPGVQNRRAGLVGIRCLHQAPGKDLRNQGRRGEEKSQRVNAQNRPQ